MSDQKSFEELLAEFRNPDLRRSRTREEHAKLWFELEMSQASDADLAEDIIEYVGPNGDFWPFGNFPATDAMSKLASADIHITRYDFRKLVAVLRVYANRATRDLSKKGKEREKKIADSAKFLVDILSFERSKNRIYWANLDSDNEDGPEAVIEIPALIEDLRNLHLSAQESLTISDLIKDETVEPSGNNTTRRDVRFYRLILLAFWGYQLGREIKTSTDDSNNGSGPLIRFMEIMSAGEPDTPDALRQWIRRNADKVGYFKDHFGDRLTLEDLLKPATYTINE